MDLLEKLKSMNMYSTFLMFQRANNKKLFNTHEGLTKL